MAKYRSRPVEVDAVMVPIDVTSAPTWVSEAYVAGHMWSVSDGVRVKTNHGVALARPGTWIIRQLSGEVYPCDDATFKAKYELVE